MWFAFDAEHLSIDASGASDLATLAQINIHFRRRKPVRRSRLHLDKTERVCFISDDIDFRVDDCAAQVSADRQSEVGRDQAVAKLLEACSRVSFAEFAE